MASTIVILCFVAGTCYILRWIFLYFGGEHDKIEGVRNKYVLITGSGSGFGKEIAIHLDQLGFRVIATCRTKAGEDSVRAVCSNRVKTFCMDVTDINQVQEVYENIKKEIPADEGNSRKYQHCSSWPLIDRISIFCKMKILSVGYVRKSLS